MLSGLVAAERRQPVRVELPLSAPHSRPQPFVQLLRQAGAEGERDPGHKGGAGTCGRTRREGNKEASQ